MTELGQSIVGTLAAASPEELISASAVVLVMLVVIAEALARRGDVPYSGQRLAVASLLGFGGLLVSAALSGLLAFSFVLWSQLAPGALAEFWVAHPVMGWISAFVAFDAVGHLHHRIGHQTCVGRAAHAPHHSDAVFEASLALRQSWLPVHGLVVLPLPAVGGWSMETIVVCAAISNLLQALQHVTSAPTLPGWIRAVVITPREHRIHHETAELSNLGPILTVWDRWGGTYRANPPERVGPVAVEPPLSLFAAQFDGWRELLGRPKTIRRVAR